MELLLIRILFFAISFLICFVAVAQDFSQPTFRSQQGNIIESQRNVISTRYRGIVRQSLGKYFDSRSYIVNTKVNLLPIYQPDTTLLNEVEELPGLPVLPSELRQQPFEKKGPYKVENIFVEVLIDTSFTEEDVEFIENVVRLVTSFDELRGDELFINRRVFPAKRSWNNQQQPFEVAKDSTKEALERLQEELLKEKDDPQDKALEHFFALMPFILLGLFILIIVWFVTRSISKSRKKDNETGSHQQDLSPVMNDLQEIKTKMLGHQSQQEEMQLQNLKSFIVSAFVGNAKQSRDVLTSWLKEEQEEEGIKNIGTLIHNVDDRLLEVLRTEMSSDQIGDIEDAIKASDSTPNIEEVRPLLENFRTEYRKKSKIITDSSEQEDLFGFLKYLNEEQILHLIKREDPGVSSVAVAQLNPEIATRILRRLDENQRSQILGQMGKINKLSVSAYKKLALQLSKRAVKVFNMKHVAVDGTEKIIDILNNLSINEQEKYLENLNQTDMELAQKVRRYFVSWSGIPELPPAVLREIVPQIERNEIILATYEADPAIYDKLLEFLPERMKLLIESEHSVNEYDNESVQNARKGVLTLLRQEAKSLNLDLTEGEDSELSENDAESNDTTDNN